MPSTLIPSRFLFRWSFGAPCLPHHAADDPLKLPESSRLPPLTDFDGGPSWCSQFVWWNMEGLGVAWEVQGRKKTLSGKSKSPQDWMKIWINTRSTRDIHRATKFCHQFQLSPSAGNQFKNDSVIRLPISQAREPSGNQSTNGVTLRVEPIMGGYRASTWFPGEILYGFDPANHPRLGFYSEVQDAELGCQPLTVGEEFPYDFDPSLWQTIELVK